RTVTACRPAPSVRRGDVGLSFPSGYARRRDFLDETSYLVRLSGDGFGSRISTLGIVPPLAHALAVSRRGEPWDLNSSTGVTCRAQRDDHGKLLFVSFRQQRRRVRRRPISAAAGRCFAGLGAFLTEAKAELRPLLALRVSPDHSKARSVIPGPRAFQRATFQTIGQVRYHGQKNDKTMTMRVCSTLIDEDPLFPSQEKDT
ncbi:hypothetical protein THAOC_03911, partial [Thalassiosira oceanica]